MKTALYLFIILMCCCGYANAQILEGVVTDSAGRPIYPVDVYNASKQKSVTSNDSGRYIIAAQTGDSIFYSSPGYKVARKKVLQAASMSAKMNVTLVPLMHTLEEVVINGEKKYDYHTDSVEQAAIYRSALAKTHPSPIMSPVSAIAEQFSKKAKSAYKFQTDFRQTETEKFIDTRYYPILVTSVTGLVGDSVAHFMYQYPMPYEFARSASDLEVKMWIRTNYKVWMKQQAMPALTSGK